MSQSLAQQLKAIWIIHGVRVNPGLKPEQIATFEQTHSIIFPRCFKDYLMVADGMVKGEMDSSLISFISLDEMRRELTRLTRPTPTTTDVIFADFLINSHVYFIRLTSDTPAAVYATDCGGAGELLLASSFNDFLRLYMSAPEKVVKYWETDFAKELSRLCGGA